FRSPCPGYRVRHVAGCGAAQKGDGIRVLCYNATMEGGLSTMAGFDWSGCPLVEVIPGKVSGAPLLKNTRLPVEAITGNYDAFRAEGLSPEAAMAETLDCYPE